MMAEESESPEAGDPGEPTADLLAERRARRAQEGDPVLLRRAEAAEAAVRNLETHLAALERRLEETGRHVRDLDAELAWLRERDLRLAGLVRELIAMAGGLRIGFERELAQLRTHLEQRMDSERRAYVRELTTMGGRIEELRGQATRAAEDLRAQPPAAQSSVEQFSGEQSSVTQPSGDQPPGSLVQSPCGPLSEREAAQRREMADALVAAVDRLRARVAEVKADEQVQASTPAQPTQTVPEQTAPVQSAAQPEPVQKPEAVPSVQYAPGQAPAPERMETPEPAPSAPSADRAPEPVREPAPEPVRGGIVVAIAESHDFAQAATARQPHTHSLSLFRRWRNRRKQRHSS